MNIFNQKTTLKGQIVSLPIKKNNKIEFIFKTKYGKIKVNSYQENIKFQPSQIWELHLKIKEASFLKNPTSFNYQNYLLENNILTYANLLKNNHLIKQKTFFSSQFLNVLRYSIFEIIEKNIKNNDIKNIALALILGEKNALSFEQKELFNITGVSHLMVISGLHIGLIFLFGIIFLKFVNLFFTIKQSNIFLLSFFITFIYALLTSLSIPTQRAILMLLIFVWCRLNFLNISQKRIFLLALIFIIANNPLSIFGPSFYLSFCAVFFLIFAINNIMIKENIFLNKNQSFLQKAKLNLNKFLYPQFVILISLCPLSLYYFNYFSIFNFFINIIAIPFISFLILPLLFIAILFYFLHINIFFIVTFLLEIFIKFLEIINNFSLLSSFSSYINFTMLITSLFGALLIFSPKALKLRFLGILLFFSVFFYNTNIPNNIVARIFILDVGQGLSIFFQTKNNNFLYDVGDIFISKNSIAKMEIKPFLQYLNIKNIDSLILSHNDKDHTGDFKTILKSFKVKKIYSSFKVPYKNFSYCNENIKPWYFNEFIKIEFLNNISNNKSDNNNSCVVLIHIKKYKILLTGDIEKAEELNLINKYSILKVDILIVPHHGSKTSSSDIFLDSLKPKFAIISAGFNNKYNHPHKIVLERYKKRNIKILNTSLDGMIKFNFYKNGNLNYETFYKKN